MNAHEMQEALQKSREWMSAGDLNFLCLHHSISFTTSKPNNCPKSSISSTQSP